MGNGSFTDANSHSLDILLGQEVEGTGVTTLFATLVNASNKIRKSKLTELASFRSTQMGIYQPALQRMASSIIVSGSPLSIPSFCGSNCSYNITIDAPWLQCETTLVNLTIGGQDISTIYDAYWINPGYPDKHFLTIPTVQEVQTYNGSAQSFAENIVSSFFIETLSLSAIYGSGSVLITQQNMTCTPGRTIYTLQNTYENNIPKMNIIPGQNEKLTNINLGINVVEINSTENTIIPSSTPDYLAWYRDVNLIALIGVTLDSLAGSYVTYEWTIPNSTPLYISAEGWTHGIAWKDWGDLEMTNFFLGR